MKHLFITLAISAASIFNTSKAAGPITPQAQSSFRETYTHATDVHWTDVGNLYKVSFKIDGKAAYAYYNADGSWVGTTKNVSTAELSPRLKNNLKKQLKAGYISDLFSVTGEDGEVYFAVIEHPDSKEIFKSINGKRWSFYSKVDKY